MTLYPRRSFTGKPQALVMLFALALLTSCATKPPEPKGPTNYVVLLPDADGKVGKVHVKSDKGAQTIETAGQGSFIDGATAPFAVPAEQFKRDFGAVLAASPEAPERYYLYFESGGAKLTAESLALVPTILKRVTERDNVDVSVIGHSDTAGKAEANAVLAYQRATTIANMLRERGMQAASLVIESHGESNLLVPTPDDTPEPRNRRVEITLR